MLKQLKISTILLSGRQFRMARLDEDDDDLIGDMDDFVGNQGPTFSSFR